MSPFNSSRDRQVRLCLPGVLPACRCLRRGRGARRNTVIVYAGSCVRARRPGEASSLLHVLTYQRPLAYTIMVGVRARPVSTIQDRPPAPVGAGRPECPRVHGESPVEQALGLVLERAAAGYETDGRWETRVRAALSGLLRLFDEQPELARLCVVYPEPAGRAAREVREQTQRVLLSRIDDGRSHARRDPPPDAARAVLAGTMGAIRAQLLEPDAPPVGELLDPLMSFIVLPYRGAAAARAEVTRRA